MNAPGRDLDPLLHQGTRARIMAFLYRNREAPFTVLRDELKLTPGNLAAHAAKLQSGGYLQQRRVLAGLFEVRYFITPMGAEAFQAYVSQLRHLISFAGVANNPGTPHDLHRPQPESAAQTIQEP